jgi:hypothetical protein
MPYDKLPYRASFRNVVGNFEFPVDRFNLLKDTIELPCYSIVKDPKYKLENLTNDWEDRYYSILDSVADKIYTTAGNRTITLMYSGGIDSVCALVSLRKHPKFKEFLEAGKFNLAMTSYSIGEYPELFYRDILPNIPIVPLNYPKLMSDPNVLLVTGDMGDHVIGSTDILKFSKGNVSDLDLMDPWINLLPYITRIDNSTLYQDIIIKLARQAPFEIKSINQLSWWWANALDHQDDLIRPWYWSTTGDLSDIATQNKIFRFFYDDDVMTFSFEYMSTNPEYHNYIDNKLWPKRYIVNATNDVSYMNKQKAFSQRMSLRQTYKTQIYEEDGVIKFSNVRSIDGYSSI